MRRILVIVLVVVLASSIAVPATSMAQAMGGPSKVTPDDLPLVKPPMELTGGPTAPMGNPHGTPPGNESPPMEVAELARRYPDGQFIMAHMGAQFEHGLRAVADCSNVAVDYCGSINEKGAYEMGVDLLGPERVVFGTDLPGGDYYVNAGRVLELDVPDNVKQQVFADNILGILGKQGPLPQG